MTGEPLPVFVHVLKTGGTSVREAFYANAKGRPFLDVLLQVPGEDLHGLPLGWHTRHQDVTGLVGAARKHQHELAYLLVNLPYGVHRYLSRDVCYLSMLREPVARAVSYLYFTHNNHPEVWDRFVALDLDAERLVSEASAFTLANAQIRALTGITDIWLDKSHLEHAQTVVRNEFGFVGAIERFDESLDRLADLLGWANRPHPRLNIGDYRDAGLVPSRTIDQLRALNEYDAALHEWLLDEYLPATLST